MRRRGIVLAVAVAATLAACSSSDDAGPAPTTVTPTTIATITSPPPTTSAPTTDTPTTTVDPDAALAAQVENDYRETFQSTNDAFQDPSDDARRSAALDGYIETAREFVATRLEEFRANGWASTPSPSIAAELLVESAPRLHQPASDLAEMQVCEVDPWVVVERGAGPGGSDLVVDDEVYTSRSTLFLRLVDGKWRLEGSDEIGRWSGQPTCPPE